MLSPEFEPVDQMSPVKRYYNDLRRSRESYVNLLIAAERLLDGEGLGDTGRGYDRLYGNAIPLGRDFEYGPEEAFNRFAIIPMTLVAPWVEQTQDEPAVKQWYVQLARQIKVTAGDPHTNACYIYEPENPDMGCTWCMACPRRHLAHALLQGTDHADLTSVPYLVDPERTRAITLDRLEVAKEHGIITNQDYMVKASLYVFDYDDRFSPSNNTVKPE